MNLVIPQEAVACCGPPHRRKELSPGAAVGIAQHLAFGIAFSMFLELFPQGPRGAPRAREERAEGPGPRPGARQGALAAAKTTVQHKPVYVVRQFPGRQSAILQGRLPPAAAACPPPGSCHFFDFPLVFPCESAMVQGVLRRSPEGLARGPGAPGHSSQTIDLQKATVVYHYHLDCFIWTFNGTPVAD